MVATIPRKALNKNDFEPARLHVLVNLHSNIRDSPRQTRISSANGIAVETSSDSLPFFPLSLVFPGVLAHYGLNDYSVITLLNPSLRAGPRGKATSVSKANELFSFLSLLPVLLPCSNLAAYPPSTNFTLIIVRNSFSICRVYIVVASLQIIYLKQRIK